MEQSRIYSSREFQYFFKSSNRSLVLKANPPHFTVVAVSDDYLKITHKERADVLGNNLFEVYPGSQADPSEKNSVYSSFIRAINTRETDVLPIFKYEILVAETGKPETIYWSNLNEPLLDDDGNVAYIVNTTANVTEQVESREALQQMNEELTAINEELSAANEEQTAVNEELLLVQKELLNQTHARQKAIDRLEANEENIRNMVRQAPVGMCIVQGDPLYVVETNNIFLEITGKPREEFYNTPYWDVNAEAKAYYEPITDNVLKTGTTYFANEHEILLIRKGNPEIVFVDFVYEPMKDETGNPYAIIIVAIDVTEKVLSRRKIEQAEANMRIATESADLGTWSLYINSDEFIASARSKEIFGLLPDEVLSQQVQIAKIHPDYRKYAADAMQASFVGGTPLDIEYPLVQNNEEKLRWVRAVGKLIDDQKGSGKYITGVLADISEQKQDEQRKNDFIGMVSHEMKTPITTISTYLQLLLLKANGEDKLTVSMLQKSNKQIARITNLINGFLNVSRLESGKIQIDKQRFDMAELIKDSEEETISMYNSHRIVFAPVEEMFVVADRDKINQVINNLISNAVKYSPANTTINVACVTTHGMARVSVTDQGIGIKPEDQDKLFERYYRVNNDNSASVSGFGIGLYLCAEIIQRHDGKIWVESVVGTGSIFSFTLPVVV